jgi:lipid-A-disaccharide synthase-like uncharacterized protein
MTGTSLWVFSTGVVGQLLFSARMIVQWLHSEKAGRPLSPVIFWQLSLLGSIVFFAYGVLRRDFAIVLGQLIVYFIYIRNLHLKDQWATLAPVVRWVAYLVPAASLAYLFSSAPGNLLEIVGNRDVPLWLVIWGTLGQLVFTFRFVVQWIESEARRESVLSRRFWIVSLAGSVMIMSYAALRRDPVLLLGQLAGVVAYARNLVLGGRS